MLKVLCISSSALLLACSGAGQDVQKNRYIGYDAQTTVCGQNQVNNLFLMTPHYYRASQAGRLAIAQRVSLDITVDVVFSVFRKNVGRVKNSEKVTC